MRPGTRYGVYALILSSTVALSSCSEYMAKNSLEDTTALVARMENSLNGNQHAAADLENIKTQINSANQQLREGNASGAKSTAKAAEQLAEQTLEKVISAEANASYSKASGEIQVATRNNADKLDPARWARIQELKAQADEQRAKNQNEKVIATSGQIIQEITTILSQLVTDSTRAKTAAVAKLEELKAENGAFYAPETLVEVKDGIDQADKFANEDRDYTIAKIRYDEAKSIAERGIEQVQRAKSRERIDEIDGFLATALLEGANEYVPNEFRAVRDLHENLLADFAENRYIRVLEGATQVRPRAQDLVVNTKRAASDARIKDLDSKIIALTEGGARQYLPGRVEELDTLLAAMKQIRTRNDEPAFDEVKGLAVRGIDLHEGIIRSFNDLALVAIRAASASLETAQAVYDRSTQVYEPATGNLAADQVAFETQKKARQAELGQTLSNLRRNLQDAFLDQEAQRFRASIQNAEQIKRTAEDVVAKVYHVVAHNTAIELANLISRYERDGAREYAPEELARSTAELEQVKRLTADGRFQDAVARAAESRANVELMAQRIAGRATVNLREARTALRDASSELTRRYRSEMLADVQRLIEEAEGDLRNQSLKGAVEKADAAISLAAQAKREASMSFSRETIDSAKRVIDRAQKAGAELYAGRELQDAKNLLGQAEARFAGEDFDVSGSLATSSQQRATEALYKKVIDAEAAFATARSVGGWDQSASRLGEAGAKIREARAEIDKDNFRLGAALADSAREIATAVANDAKESNFEQAAARVRRNLSAGTRQGINFFQPEESIDARTRLTALENKFTLSRYDEVMGDMARLEADLRTTLDTTDDLVAKVADQQTVRLNRLVEEGANLNGAPLVEEARRNLEYARLDFRRGLYKPAHSALNKAISIIDELELRGARESYMATVSELLARLRDSQARFSHVLGLNASQLRGLALGAGAPRALSIGGRMNPSEFREEMERLYSETLALAPPRGYDGLNTVLTDAMNEARVSALQFERLNALNTASAAEVDRLITSAYNGINRANKLVLTVQQQLRDDATQMRNGSSLVGMAK